MTLVFFGTPAAAVPSLEALVRAGHSVPLVVTRPDRPAGRSGGLRPPPVKQAARRLGIDVFQPVKLRDEAFVGRLSAAGAQMLVVVAFGRILGRRVLDLTPRGAVNVHFSLLPAYRGAAPVQWALAHGEMRTGVTTMRINERLDEGDLLLQREVSIREEEHAPALERRLAAIGAELLVETVAALVEGTLEPRPQDPDRATYAPMLRACDGWFDHRLSAREVEGRVRGFDPWPGVWVSHAGKRLRIIDARAVPQQTTKPSGELLRSAAGGPLLVCAGGTQLQLVRVQPEGRRVMGVQDAVNGRHVRLGERFEGAPRSG